jgi:hypothetical protein
MPATRSVLAWRPSYALLKASCETCPHIGASCAGSGNAATTLRAVRHASWESIRPIARDNARRTAEPPSRTSTATPPPPTSWFWFASQRRGSLTSMFGNQLVDLNRSCLPDFLSSSLTQIDNSVDWRSLIRPHGLASSSQSRPEQLLSLIPRHRVIIFRVD